ncbi:MAG TPA: hypothetical protein DEP84_13890, partial [Chloroflexi bacterium]|nr:hypothetical protein [Chloroflexota bacterium]
MKDLIFLCFTFALFFGAILFFMLISRFLAGQTRGGSYPPPGTYDNPNIRSGGSIGGGFRQREYDAPDIRSGGSFGGSGGRTPGPASP